MKQLLYLFICILLIGCFNNTSKKQLSLDYLKLSKNILDYNITPKSKFDKSGLMFSDQGAWFAYSFPKEASESIGFTGPFLMTQQNGVWLATTFADLIIKENNQYLNFKNDRFSSYSSHLEQSFNNTNVTVEQELVFKNGHTSLLKTIIKNNSSKDLNLQLIWGHSPILANGISLSIERATKLFSHLMGSKTAMAEWIFTPLIYTKKQDQTKLVM